MRMSTLTAALAAALALTAPLAAAAAPLTVGAELAPRWTVTASRTVDLFSDSRTTFAPGLHALVQPTERLGLAVGWRPETLERVHADGTRAALDTDTLLLGASWRHPLAGPLAAHGRLDLELAFAEAELDAGGVTAHQDALGFGVHPQLGLELRLVGAATPSPDARFALHLRGLVGYLLQTDLALDALSTGDPQVRPVDLGDANLSGLTVTFALAATF